MKISKKWKPRRAMPAMTMYWWCHGALTGIVLTAGISTAVRGSMQDAAFIVVIGILMVVDFVVNAWRSHRYP